MTDESWPRGTQRWAQFRFSIVGPLLASPPGRGKLGKELEKLASKPWLHPMDGGPYQPKARTIETWYYQARERRDPVAALQRKRRSDGGKQRAVAPALAELLRSQYRDHPGWSVQLHRDNLQAEIRQRPDLGPCPSYSTILRFLRLAHLKIRLQLEFDGTPRLLKPPCGRLRHSFRAIPGLVDELLVKCGRRQVKSRRGPGFRIPRGDALRARSGAPWSTALTIAAMSARRRR